MSEQTNDEQNDVLKNDIKTEIKAELKAELARELASVLRKKLYRRILYPVITFIAGLGIGLCASHIGHHGSVYEHYYGYGVHHYDSENHSEKQQDQKSKR
ncbi:MAG: hypothetical protein ACXVHV_11145 [Methanobacterium sp.]